MGITDNGIGGSNLDRQVVVVAPCLLQSPTATADRKRVVFGKMKVLKKIKKRMGLASRSSTNGHGTNNLPPLLFHNVCGENIRISREGTTARRAESFCKGIAFSSRPTKVNEKICIKFLEISNNWSGVIRFGFSYNDPSTLRDGLPKYACPDLTNKPGYWAKALPERFCNQGTVLFYYVSAAGDVHFGINNEEKGIFFGGVETRGPLWALIDVYGNSTAIEFVDSRHQLNNARRSAREDPPTNDVDRIICSTQNLNLHAANHQRENTILDCAELNQLQLRYQPVGGQFVPMPLHRTRGRNVRFTNGSRNEAARLENEFCQGYVFTSRPLTLNQTIVIQILASAPLFQGCLGLGLTSCDPATLSPADLPDDSNFLLDRPEYWVISRDFARSLNVGDEVSFCVSATGEVEVRRNGATAPSVVMHVDQTLKLWAVLDVYGGTRRIRVLSQQMPQQIVTPTRPLSAIRVVTPNSESMNSLNEQMMLRRTSQQRLTFGSADIQVQPSANGGAVLSVILPPSHAANIMHTPTPVPPPTVPYTPHNQLMAPHTSQHHGNAVGSTNGASASALTRHARDNANVNLNINEAATAVATTPAFKRAPTWVEQNGTNGNAAAAPPAQYSAGAECTICYENAIDAVLYMCGHMCMCYECALQQWRGKGGGHCPLCRALIRDVIRTYKS